MTAERGSRMLDWSDGARNVYRAVLLEVQPANGMLFPKQLTAAAMFGTAPDGSLLGRVLRDPQVWLPERRPQSTKSAFQNLCEGVWEVRSFLVDERDLHT